MNMRELDREVSLGGIEIQHGENSAIARYDRLTHHHAKLLMVSLTVETIKLKAIRAMLAANKGAATITCSGAPCKQQSQEDYCRTMPRHLWADDAKYDCHVERLDYGYVHAIFVSRSQNFLLTMTPASVWHALMSARFTTPLIRSWMPWLTRRMIAEEALQECSCFRAESGWLALHGSAQLDSLVSEGLAGGHLTIGGSSAERCEESD